MNKFKIGDRVRYIGKDSNFYGKKAIIVSVINDICAFKWYFENEDEDISFVNTTIEVASRIFEKVNNRSMKPKTYLQYIKGLLK